MTVGSQAPAGDLPGAPSEEAAERSAQLTGAEPEAPAFAGPLNIRSVSLTILAVLAAIAALQIGQQLFIPIVLGILISYALDPLVIWLMKLRLPRAVAAAVLLVLVVWGGGALAYSLSDETAQILQQLPGAAQKFRQTLRRTPNTGPGAIEKVQQAANELQKTANEATGTTRVPRGVTRVQIEQPALNVGDYLWWGSMGALAVAGQLVLLLFLLFFLLASGDLYKRKLVKIVGPSLSQKKITVQILDDITAQIERFLFVQLLTSVLVGFVSYLAFRWFGLQQAGVWAIGAGLFNSVPYLGPVIVTGGIFVVSFMQFEVLSTAALVALVSLVITSLEGFLLTPWLTSRAAQMNAVAIFIGLLFWTFVWGVWGTLLAVPMMMVVKSICDRVEDLKPIGEMLGD